MFRRLALLAALCLAPVVSASAQSPSHAAQHDTTQCATLHTMMLQHAGAMGIDSTELVTLHTTMKEAIARGVSPDSLHHAILRTLMHNTDGHMPHMQLDSAHAAAIHACLDSHAGAKPEKRR